MPHGLMLYFGMAISALLGYSARRMPSAGHASQTSSTDQTRLARLEAKVNLLLDKLGVEHDMPGDEVKYNISQGLKINAIKAYREQNPGVGLKEAKDAVEAMEEQMKAGNYR